jgi:hypothetical protein
LGRNERNATRHFVPDFFVFANSEHSQDKNNFLKHVENIYDWYYFYHGFAALYWFDNIRFTRPNKQYSRLFITLNHLITENRSYRLTLLAHMIQHGLQTCSHISVNQKNPIGQIKQEIFNANSRLTVGNKKLILTHLPAVCQQFILDQQPHGALSASDDVHLLTQGLFHIVTETVYYDEKLHLTEKAFKPIVAQRPFMLVAAPGNLAYLKQYGFRTFDQWIDESYDLEPDPELRIKKIVAEMLKLAKLPDWRIAEIHSEMQSTLEHNFYHFYTDFKQIIVNEMVDNFRRCVIKHNAGRHAGMQNFIDHAHMDWHQIKRRLSM